VQAIFHIRDDDDDNDDDDNNNNNTRSGPLLTFAVNININSGNFTIYLKL
jgi:hypothetical protein